MSTRSIIFGFPLVQFDVVAGWLIQGHQYSREYVDEPHCDLIHLNVASNRSLVPGCHLHGSKLFRIVFHTPPHSRTIHLTLPKSSTICRVEGVVQSRWNRRKIDGQTGKCVCKVLEKVQWEWQLMEAAARKWAHQREDLTVFDKQSHRNRNEFA